LFSSPGVCGVLLGAITSAETFASRNARIDLFAPGGGFVFNAIHNIQARTPVQNVLAMFKAVRDSGK
jgi:uroporphyrinogen-III decarboxylase